MGFSNTKKYENTINNLQTGMVERLKNPYYMFSDKKGMATEYYNRHTTETTLDESTRQEYSEIGLDSPVRYNLIHNAFIYGIQRLEQSWERGDFGMESSSIDTEFVVLPNTFIPYADDFFIITHGGKTHLFRVTSVTVDTMESGANFYKCTAMYWKEEDVTILNKQVISEFEMIMDYIGTENKPIILSSEYKFINKIDDILERLMKYYEALFFRTKVQTFIYEYEIINIYDPYMIEFLIRNHIFENKDHYIDVMHQLTPNKTFAIDYDRSFFRAIETKDLSKFKYNTNAVIKIEDKFSLFSTRSEEYYRLTYNDPCYYRYNINIFPDFFYDNLKNNKYYTDDNLLIYNIIIKYFNNARITETDLDMLDKIDYSSAVELFYAIPEVMFILEQCIKSIVK